MKQKIDLVYGFHNAQLEETQARLLNANTYKDCSTVIICPTRGMIHHRVVSSWMVLLRPMNQKVIGPIFFANMEVADAYNTAIETILAHVELKKWKFILTLEEDNMPPPDGLLKIYEGMKKYDVISGLYFTKGAGGQPQIYGNPKDMPLNYIPQIPVTDTIQECNGLGMGFTLFKLAIFKDEKLRKPWFKTCQEHTPGLGSQVFSQDLWFFSDIKKHGYRMACDTRIRVGHYSIEEDIIW